MMYVNLGLTFHTNFKNSLNKLTFCLWVDMIERIALHFVGRSNKNKIKIAALHIVGGINITTEYIAHIPELPTIVC